MGWGWSGVCACGCRWKWRWRCSRRVQCSVMYNGWSDITKASGQSDGTGLTSATATKDAEVTGFLGGGAAAGRRRRRRRKRRTSHGKGCEQVVR